MSIMYNPFAPIRPSEKSNDFEGNQHPSSTGLQKLHSSKSITSKNDLISKLMLRKGIY